MSMPEWEPEARPVPAELTDDFPHATYPPKRVEWVSFADKLSAADSATLMQLMHGGIGEPHE